MSNPSLASVAELERLLNEEIGSVDEFRRALDGAPDSIRPGLLLCLRFHNRCVRHLRKLIKRVAESTAETSGMLSASPDDFEIIDAVAELPLSTSVGT